jgi:saccharopine dehydrogenase-like NADP-dependent oxidoreductase
MRQVIKLIEETHSDIILNLGSAFVNMTVLDACIEAGVTYIDTAIHEEPDRVASICEPPPWYGNYEWKRKEVCAKKGINAILGIGFDPGVVNAYAALAARDFFDDIDSIDILDVNIGSHGRYFATNFDPEINFREFTGRAWSWVDREWVESEIHADKMVYDFPEVGPQTVYLTGHDEIHSLSQNLNINSIRFWMGFGSHYINVFTVLKNLGLLSEKPVRTAEGVEVVPLKVVKACLPDPMSLAQGYTGKTCIGNLTRGTKNGIPKEVFIYNICDHEECYKEVEAQAISYTAGVPVAAAAILVRQGIWNPGCMANVEELDPTPLIDLIGKMGLPTEIISK